MTPMTLDTAPTRRSMRVVGIQSAGPISTRLLEMGVTEGTEVTVLRRAPLGDPLHIRVSDCELSLRRCDAALVHVAV